MHNTRLVHDLRFRAASDADRATGLWGWASFRLHGLHIDGAQIRRTRTGEIAFFWPERSARGGRLHTIVRPVDEATAAAVEAEVISSLRARGDVP